MDMTTKILGRPLGFAAYPSLFGNNINVVFENDPVLANSKYFIRTKKINPFYNIFKKALSDIDLNTINWFFETKKYRVLKSHNLHAIMKKIKQKQPEILKSNGVLIYIETNKDKNKIKSLLQKNLNLKQTTISIKPQKTSKEVYYLIFTF